MLRTTAERLRRIQRHLGIEPDGLLGPQTLAAIENALPGFDGAEPEARPDVGLRLSRDGVAAIVRFEIGSDAYYERCLRAPSWPGGDSGVTIGVGYDLGYQSPSAFRADWDGMLAHGALERLAVLCGLKGHPARDAVDGVSDLRVPLRRAREVFARRQLPRYARLAAEAYPGLEALPPDAQSALVSLVLNRGASLAGDSRREMARIRDQVAAGDLDGIARSIESMKRLWAGRGLDGLLKRRDAEAALVRGAARRYSDDEVVAV